MNLQQSRLTRRQQSRQAPWVVGQTARRQTARRHQAPRDARRGRQAVAPPPRQQRRQRQTVVTPALRKDNSIN